MGYLGTVILLSMQGIMIYRISSMYTHNRKIVTLLNIAFVLEMVSLLSIQSLSNVQDVPIQETAPGINLCSQASFPSWLYTVWIPVTCFEVLVLALSVSLAVKYCHSVEIIRRAAPSRNSLVYILLRDSITFPFVTLTICIANLVSWMQLPYIAVQCTFSIAIFGPCIIGSRLILNLREAYYQPFKEECNIHDQDDFRINEIDFPV
ncbi:hypothetical protein GALMADRAFT_633266 [Galerina marginata CBS 339.88]|uniref:G-protein coupled receptors family 1 profile domain-containing protein n=1 Tax=Galerina marginata (strain CBS 339.88) TaxID=685588 RepID=A0A067SUQ7_GALM3|nr:hypothetical protein GALMADRAFT_633266 [Galerina marginata CBS 339.88]